MKNTVLTGIKPTGTPHLGNLLGAIKPALDMTKALGDANFIYFIADYHALTAIKDPQVYSQYLYEIAATWLAFGLDPKKVIFYKHSDVPEIFELNWILACHTPKGDMNRAHAYKAAVDANREKGDSDLDHKINMGLFTYPILMAADILLFNANLVPVGKDQVQHVEIARSMAQRFNQYYGDTFVEPKELLQNFAQILPGLDGRKMSKSYNNTIPLFLEENKLRKLINKIKTDSSAPDEPKNPNDSLIFSIYKEIASEEMVNLLREKYLKGISWGEAKQELFNALNFYLKGPREKYNAFMNDKAYIEKELKEGALKARELASPVLQKVRKAIGNF